VSLDGPIGLTSQMGRDIVRLPMTADDFAAQLARERALKQAEKMETIGRLTGAIAQQFTELLTAILARTTALARTVPPNRNVEEIRDTAQRGAELAQRLLGFSRHRALDLQPVILAEFVRDVLDTMRRALPANIEVQFEADEDAGVIEADPSAVKQVLHHLVTNARDAMSTGGTLHVEVRRARLGAADRPLHAWVEPGSYVSVALSDTGVGMDAQTMARVFEPFFTTKPVGVGTGLGMSMAYGLVKQHRGYLHLYSEVGQGTTAKVYFPAVRGRGGPDLEGDAAADEHLPGGTETILLVEDDPTMRLAAQQVLTKVGYRVVTAVDGQQGLDAFHAHRAVLRLVVTDVVMPKMSGFELYEAIRGEARGLGVLFMSGFPAPNFRKTVGRDPHVAFVTKPWTASELLAQVRAVLQVA
jgi:two-component system, cell cycle sensor histidine kinase and response regulator CckA